MDEDPTLEQAGNFFHMFSGPLIEYNVKNGVHMDVFKELEGRGTPRRGPMAVQGEARVPLLCPWSVVALCW